MEERERGGEREFFKKKKEFRIGAKGTRTEKDTPMWW
jgi:hypothetical protein